MPFPKIAPSKVPMYRFDLVHVNGSNCKKYLTQYWEHWGWCRPEEVLCMLNINYGFNWSLDEFFKRFLPFGAPRIDSHGHGLTVLTPLERNRFRASNNYRHLKPGVFLPVTWGNDLLFEVVNGARRYYIDDQKRVVVGPETGQGDHYL